MYWYWTEEELKRERDIKRVRDYMDSNLDVMRSFSWNRGMLMSAFPDLCWDRRSDGYSFYKLLERVYYQRINGESYASREYRVHEFRREEYYRFKGFKYESLLSDMVPRGSYIIVNNDDDGIFSGCLLVKLFGCRIVGFYNKNGVVLLRRYSDINLKDCVFIDSFMSISGFRSIDNHYISLDSDDNHEHVSDSCTLNPNVLTVLTDGRMVDYSSKYPFGTFHFLWCLAERELKSLSAEFLYRKIDGSDLLMGDLIGRIDDAQFSTTVAYKNNCREWWELLHELSYYAPNILKLMRYIKMGNTGVKDKVRKFMKERFDMKSGSFHVCPGRLPENSIEYIRFVSDAFGVDLGYICKGVYVEFRGVSDSMKVGTKSEKKRFKKMVASGAVMSYARTSGNEISYSVFDFFSKSRFVNLVPLCGIDGYAVCNVAGIKYTFGNNKIIMEHESDSNMKCVIDINGKNMHEIESKMHSYVINFYKMCA